MSVGWLFLAGIATLGASAAASFGQTGSDNDVVVELAQFGVGNAYRPGGVVAARLILTSNLDEPTPCWVQWEIPNAEGDVAEYGRSVTLSPGMSKPEWLYAPISPHVDAETVWTVRVFEEREGKRRRELGGARISPALAGATRHDVEKGMIAVVGRARMRLEDYASTWNARSNPPGAHEETRVVSGIAPTEMPDRWEGLLPFEAVIWSNAQPAPHGPFGLKNELKLRASCISRPPGIGTVRSTSSRRQEPNALVSAPGTAMA